MMSSGVFAMESTCGLCGGQSGTGPIFSLGTSVFPDSIIWPVLCIHSLICHCCYVVSAVDSVV